MPDPISGHVTQLLRSAAGGDGQAAAELLPLLYSELRSLARSQLARNAPGNTLQATALVHEAYLKLVGAEDPGWASRSHFFGAAANAMRQILVDQARRKATVKHGGAVSREELRDDSAEAPLPLALATPSIDLLKLEDALRDLEKADPRKGQIVMLRYFAGLNPQQTAEALGVSVPTIDREWRFIRSFLHARLEQAESPVSDRDL